MNVLNIRLKTRGCVSWHFSNWPGALLGFRGQVMPGELIGPEAALAAIGLAIDHRVAEAGHVAAGLPDLGIHDQRTIDPHHVDFLAVGSQGRIADHVLPPALLHVLLELDAEGTIVPEAVDAAVDFTRLKDETTSAAQGHQLLHVHASPRRANPFHKYCEIRVLAFRGVVLSKATSGEVGQQFAHRLSDVDNLGQPAHAHIAAGELLALWPDNSQSVASRR